MTIPSVKKIMEIGVTKDTAIIVRAVLASDSRNFILAVSDSAYSYDRLCYHRPPIYLLKLYAVDELIETYGVEGVEAGSNQKSPAFDYCNTGDSYAATIIRVNGNYRVGCWADIIERGNYA